MLHSVCVAVTMAAVQTEHWYSVALLIPLFLKVSQQLQVPGGAVGLQDGMLLDCSCPWSGKLIMVSWTKGGSPAPLAVYHPEYGVNFHALYDGRVRFVNASPMDGSIRMSNVSAADEGVYRCSLQSFPRGSWTTSVLVQKRVSPPALGPNTGRLHASEREDVTISCSHNGTVYEVSVEKLAGANRGASVLAVCKRGDGGVELADYQRRGVVNCSDGVKLELRLNAVSPEDGGSYRCNFSADAELSSRIVHLAVVSRPKGVGADRHRRYVYSAAGAAGVLVPMAAALAFMCRNRRKARRREHRTQIHATQTQRVHTNGRGRGGACDRMKKTTRTQRKENPVYVNIPNTTAPRKGKR